MLLLLRLNESLSKTSTYTHYNPPVRIIDLVSHITYVVCVNFINLGFTSNMRTHYPLDYGYFYSYKLLLKNGKELMDSFATAVKLMFYLRQLIIFIIQKWHRINKFIC